MAVEPRRRRVPAPVAKERRVPETVATGDLIEYGITYQINVERNLSIWLKAGLTSSVQEGETTEGAWKRVRSFVDTRMEQLIEEHQTA